MTQSYWALVLNYNHWQDTVRCVESLLRCVVRPERIVICDNGSSDGSQESLAQWAETQTAGGLVRLTRTQAESAAELPPGRLVLVENGANLGYAGGNNVGLRLALASGVPFVWLLNNDTTVFPEAPGALLERMEHDGRLGLCGALTRYMDEPEIVQCYGGGWHNAVWGVGGLHGDGERLPLGAAPKAPPARLDYVNGASVFVRREFLLTVGLMEEAYFLYCEELDWAARSRGRWVLGWEPRAQVLHREGLTTGVSNRRGLGHGLRRAATLARSRLLFAWKFHPLLLPTVLAGQALAMLRKVVRRGFG